MLMVMVMLIVLIQDCVLKLPNLGGVNTVIQHRASFIAKVLNLDFSWGPR